MPPKQRFEVLSRELNERRVDGMTVRLFWVPPDVLTYVTVVDDKTGVAFKITTPEGIHPNQVFNHPHAYKADEHERAA